MKVYELHDLVNGSHGMASKEDPLSYHLPSRTMVYIFSFYIHHPWNTWSSQHPVNQHPARQVNIVHISQHTGR